MASRIFTLLSLVFLMNIAIAAPPVEEGRLIFSSRCASCHNVNKTIVGPALAGVTDRRDHDWIIKFVQSPLAMIQSGNKDAVAVYEKFNKIPMPDHKDLSAAQIESVLEFIKTESAAAPSKEVFRPEKVKPSYTPLSSTNYGFFIALGAAVILLISVLLFYVRVKEYERMHPIRLGK